LLFGALGASRLGGGSSRTLDFAMRLAHASVDVPLITLGVSTLLCVVYEVIVISHGGESSEAASWLSGAVFGFAAAWWVEVDRRQYAVSAPFEYAAFVFFLWPVAVPYHLIKTRGWNGVALGLAFLVLAFSPFFVGMVAYFVLSR